MTKAILSILLFAVYSTFFSQVDSEEKKLRDANKGSGDSTKNWGKGGTLNINATQVSLSNWAGGGQSSISLQGILNVFANYSKGKVAWDNSLDVSFGSIKTQRSDWFKNDDRIELNSKFGYRETKKIYYATLLNFRTQFIEGYRNLADQANGLYISDLLAPSYTTFALGIDFKPTPQFTIFVSPATLKVTTLMDDSLSQVGGFGVLPGETIRTEFGAYLKAAYKNPKFFGNENLAFNTDISFFTNYQNNPQNIDVTWDTQLTAKIAKYFSVSLTTNLIYDHDIQLTRYESDGITPVYLTNDQGVPYTDDEGNFIEKEGPITQLKQVLALGFAYKF